MFFGLELGSVEVGDIKEMKKSAADASGFSEVRNELSVESDYLATF